MAENVLDIQLSLDQIQLEIKKHLEFKSVPSVDLFPDEHDNGQDFTIRTTAWNLDKKELGEFYNYLTRDLKLKININNFNSRIFCWVQGEETENVPAEKPVMISRTEIVQILEQLQITMPGVKVEVDGGLEKVKIYFDFESSEDIKKNMEFIQRWLHDVNIHNGILKSPVENFLHLIIPERIIGSEKLFLYCTPEFLRKRVYQILEFADCKFKKAGGFSDNNPYYMMLNIEVQDILKCSETLLSNGYISFRKAGKGIAVKTIFPLRFEKFGRVAEKSAEKIITTETVYHKEKAVSEVIKKTDVNLKRNLMTAAIGELDPESQNTFLDLINSMVPVVKANSIKAESKISAKAFLKNLKREDLVITRKEAVDIFKTEPTDKDVPVFVDLKKYPKVIMSGTVISIPRKYFIEIAQGCIEAPKIISFEEIEEMLKKGSK